MKIRLATENDISQIIRIQNYWLNQKPKSTNGFLFGEAYTNQDLTELTSRKQIAVAVEKNIIGGYFLFDDYSRNQTTNTYKNYINKLISEEIIEYSRENVCPRAQIAVEKSFLGLNLSSLLTEFLYKKSGTKFEVIFSTVSKKNMKLETHLKNGWSIVGENEELYYVLLPIKN